MAMSDNLKEFPSGWILRGLGGLGGALVMVLVHAVLAGAAVTPSSGPRPWGGSGETIRGEFIELPGPGTLCERREAAGMLLAQGGQEMLANPDWVHPANRKNYPGYRIRDQKKKDGRDWRYKTNRPGGNTRGGGTTAYLKYRSFYRKTLTSPVKRRK